MNRVPSEAPLYRRLNAEILLSGRGQEPLAVDRDFCCSLEHEIPSPGALGRVACTDNRIAETAFDLTVHQLNACIAEAIDDLEAITCDQIASHLAEAECAVKVFDERIESSFAIAKVGISMKKLNCCVRRRCTMRSSTPTSMSR